MESAPQQWMAIRPTTRKHNMQCNAGKTDRTLRVIAGLVILGLGAYFQNWWGLIGVVPLLTGATGWCPAYIPLGINTCKTKQ
jgi:hypothetical protein